MKPAPTYHWIAFAPCAECGVDRGERCMDQDDEPAEHPCLGRSRTPGRGMIDKTCKFGHLVVGNNILHRGKYEHCRECHNRHSREQYERAKQREKT